MTDVQIFNHSMFGELPVVVVEGVEWFGGVEVAKALSFSDPQKAIANHVDEEDSTVHPVLTSGGKQNIKERYFINWLLENKFVYRDQKGKLKPYAAYVPELFELKEWEQNGKADVQTLITPKGRETFRILLQKDGMAS